MAVEKLTALKVARAKAKTGGRARYLGDGAGLYLRVSPSGTKAWVYRYKTAGRTREAGLGPLHTVSLAEARDEALQCRKQRRNGIDPIDARRAEKQAKRDAAPVATKTFQQFAEHYLTGRKGKWSPRHSEQWENSLAQYVYPRLGAHSLRSIVKNDIIELLEQPVPVGTNGSTEQFWTALPETASRVRQRVEVILRAATARELRSGETPAAWKGHLESVFPARSKRDKKHFASLRPEKVPEFVAKLRTIDTMAAAALEFCVLTGTRTDETREVPWSELDLTTGVWTLPAERTKTEGELRIALPPPARAILERLAALRDPDNPYVFSRAGKKQKPIHADALRLLIRAMGFGPEQCTTHGFRSSFSTWAYDRARYQPHVIEAALNHEYGSEVARAYNRSETFAPRAKLLADWAEFLAGETPASAEVIELVA